MTAQEPFMQNTIINLLHNGAADAPAIVAPDTEPLNYVTFKLHVTKVVAALKSFGVGRGDRVAIVLPNGPHMASAFVSIAAGGLVGLHARLKAASGAGCQLPIRNRA